MRERWSPTAVLRSSRHADVTVFRDIRVDSEKTACESRMLEGCAESEH